MYSRRNIAMICLFCDLDRRELLVRLRALPRARRKDIMCALLIEATRW